MEILMFESKTNWFKHLSTATTGRKMVCVYAIMPVFMENNP